MNRWFNPSHPQTLQAAVILGYLGAVFGLLSGAGFFLPMFIGVGVGAFGSANNKRWGYYLLTISAIVIALYWFLLLLAVVFGFSIFFIQLSGGLLIILRVMTAMVFPTALAVATIHPHTREYQRIWFE